MKEENLDITVEELKKIKEEKGVGWLIAAMVEGSIGYHSPKHAALLISRALEGETKDYCDRCSACFSEDLMKMISFDIINMKHLEEHVPERYAKVMEVVEQIKKLDDEGQSLASLMYPTGF